MRVKLVGFAQRNQAFQQIALAVDVADRAVRRQLGFTHLNGQAAALGQQAH